jgi:uncharacterized protein (DUF4415 family)
MKKQSGTNWKAVDALNEADIDYSENPRLGSDFFARAVRWPGNKQLISLRLDPDVLLFFKKQGKGYQTMINALLRKYMEAQQSVPVYNAKKSLSGTGKRTKSKKKSA